MEKISLLPLDSIPENDRTLDKFLGFTEERGVEIQEMILGFSIRNTGSKAHILELLSEKLNTIEEFAYAAYVFGKFDAMADVIKDPICIESFHEYISAFAIKHVLTDNGK